MFERMLSNVNIPLFLPGRMDVSFQVQPFVKFLRPDEEEEEEEDDEEEDDDEDISRVANYGIQGAKTRY